MTDAAISKKDAAYLAAAGITADAVAWQLGQFERGIRHMRLVKPARVGDGIVVLPETRQHELAQSFTQQSAELALVKFVPASGAASRMFQSLNVALKEVPNLPLSELVANVHLPATVHDDLLRFWQGLRERRFAFSADLANVLSTKVLPLEALLAAGRFQPVLKALLTADGLDYNHIPKALLPFHRGKDHVHTPLDEHVREAGAYATGRNAVTRIHFTITPEHEADIRARLQLRQAEWASAGHALEWSVSQQLPETRTIAVDANNRPWRDEHGNILLRPAGHGALLGNIEQLDCDILFIKNIDNVAPERLSAATVHWKKVLAGYLLEVRRTIFAWLRQLSAADCNAEFVAAVAADIASRFLLKLPAEFTQAALGKKKEILIDALNRPIRVCGMVANAGEPGGGPFFVSDDAGRVTMQIVERAQINLADIGQKEVMRSASHFNPVDLVCSTRDFQGRPFSLQRFVDADTAFISEKSQAGHTLKALELPGLWNGAMSGWITLFVEVPLATFNPVKSVLDLLRPEHQAFVP